MVAASHDQRDAPPDPHTGEGSPVGQFQRHRQFPGSPECHSPFHRLLGNTGCPGQNTSVRHKGTQPQLGKHLTDILLILCQIRNSPQLPGIQILIVQRTFHAPG